MSDDVWSIILNHIITFDQFKAIVIDVFNARFANNVELKDVWDELRGPSMCV